MSGYGDALLGEKMVQRRSSFKKGADADDARRKREDASVQLRKQKREETLLRKRTISIDAMSSGSDSPKSQASAEQIVSFCHAIMSSNVEDHFPATLQLRKSLSRNAEQLVLQSGVVPRLVEFLTDNSRPGLQFEAIWVLTTLASGAAEQTKAVVEAGAVPIFIEMLKSPNPEVQEQAIWTLGNISCDNTSFRDIVLHSGGLSPILAILQHNISQQTERTSMVRNATWTVSNLCRGTPQPPVQMVLPVLPTLAVLIKASDAEVLADSCWAFAHISTGSSEHITAVLQAGVAPRLVELLAYPSDLIQAPALRAIANIVTGDESHCKAIMEMGICKALLPLLAHFKSDIRKEACWVISSMIAGHKRSLIEVFVAGLIPPVIALLDGADFDTKREAAYVIRNITAAGKDVGAGQMRMLIEDGCMKPLIDLLDVSDTRIVLVALEALENFLEYGQDLEYGQLQCQANRNVVSELIELTGGLSKLEALQEDRSEETYQKAVSILKKYFPLDEDEDNVMADAGFGFGVDAPKGGFNFAAKVPQVQLVWNGTALVNAADLIDDS